MDVDRWGFRNWSDLFNRRQLLCLLTLTAIVRESYKRMQEVEYESERSKSVATYLALVLDRLADWNSSLCSWSPESRGGAKIGHTFGRHSADGF
jgi:putative DNA methylase